MHMHALFLSPHLSTEYWFLFSFVHFTHSQCCYCWCLKWKSNDNDDDIDCYCHTAPINEEEEEEYGDCVNDKRLAY